MSKLTNVLAGVVVLLSAGATWASTLTNQYTVTTEITKLGPDTFKFEYTVHNNNQQAPNNAYTGLDGFRIALPQTAVISDVTSPAPYHGTPGKWVYTSGPESALWWGMDRSSVYPIGTDAVFSFTASNVALGQTNAQLSTYWATYKPTFDNPASPQSHWPPYDRSLPRTSIARRGNNACCFTIA
ncbi:MAG TPA: hypothetical protein VHP11_05540, partial [Tepidisphaeraceae bacterium]|nr:hypothetical protein [Tepidisphaeraceae bacterium]